MAVPSKRSLRTKIEKLNGNVAQIAEAYNVTPKTVYNWIDRRDLRTELEEATNRHDLRAALDATGGDITATAEQLGKSRQTIYNWLREYDMWVDRDRAKFAWVAVAEDNVYKALMDGDIDTSKWVLERKGRSLGWGKSLEHTGLIGQAIFTDADIALLERSGVDVRDVVQHLLAMVRADVDDESGD